MQGDSICQCCAARISSPTQSRVLLCSDCVDENGLVVYCPSCHERLRIPAHEIESVAEALTAAVPAEEELPVILCPGATLRMKCPKCAHIEGPGTCTVFMPPAREFGDTH